MTNFNPPPLPKKLFIYYLFIVIVKKMYHKLLLEKTRIRKHFRILKSQMYNRKEPEKLLF